MEPHAPRARHWAALGCALLAAAALSATPAASLTVVAPLDSTQAGSQEANLGDLAADAVRDAGNSEAQISLLPANELRPVIIPAGRCDPSELTAALRASSDNADTVVLLHLTGAQIKKALAHGLSRLPEPYAGFLQVSGVRVAYETVDRRPEISSVTLDGSGAGLADNQTYTVATSRLLADGALGYFDIWDKSDIASDTGTPLSKALADYALAHQPLDYHVEGRTTTK